MSGDVTLKPCPFCGGDKILVAQTLDQKAPNWYATCHRATCAFTGYSATQAQAIAAWNQRADAQGEPVAWMNPQHGKPGYYSPLSPVTTYRIKGWTPLYTHPPAQDVAALVEENKRLQQALVDHNDQLRSAHSVAFRDGAKTNWQAFRGAVTYTLAEHHETVVAAREALAKHERTPHD